ncbi:MAG: ATP-binding protein, partial [Bacteroidota bacterium]
MNSDFITFKINHLPDFELAKNQEYGLNFGYLISEFDNLLHGLLSFNEIEYIDYCHIYASNSINSFVTIKLQDNIKNSIEAYLINSYLSKIYKLKSVAENISDYLHDSEFYAYYVKNSIINQKDDIGYVAKQLTLNIKNNPLQSKSFYEQKYIFDQKNDYTFVPEILYPTRKDEDIKNGIIIRIYNNNFHLSEQIVTARKTLLQIFYLIKQIESLKIENLSFDNPVKALIKGNSEWVDKIMEDFENPKIAFHDIVFFSNYQENGRFIGDFFMSKITEKKHYSIESLDDVDFKGFIDNGKKLPHPELNNFLKSIPDKYKIPKDNLDTEFFKNYLPTLRPIEELAPACRFIIPTHGPVKGIPLETFPPKEEGAKSIYIGYDENSGYEAEIPLGNLKKNMFVTGVPGSGKTTVLLNILSQLSAIDLDKQPNEQNDKSINFICFEPVKTELRSLFAMQEYKDMKDKDNMLEEGKQNHKRMEFLDGKINDIKNNLKIFSPGNDDFVPFAFNPFIIPEGVTVESHIKSLQKAFESAIPMVGPVSGLVRKTLYKLYEGMTEEEKSARIAKEKRYLFDGNFELDHFDYNEKIKKDETRQFPDILQFEQLLNSVVEEDYKNAGEVRDKIKSFISNRISALTSPSMLKIFYTKENTFGSIHDLLNSKVIIEMDALEEDESNLITMFLLSQLRNVIRTGKLNTKFNYLILLEEAHNIVGTDIKRSGEETSNPKEIASKFVTKMMAEVRSYGVGFLISDQFPTAVDPMIVKNTSTKIAHRVISQEDKEKLADSMLLTEAQKEKLTASTPGESFIFMEKWMKPLKITEPHFKGYYGIEEDFTFETIKEFIEKSHDLLWYNQANELKQEI